ncbi:arsenate reductase (glutaredoxin) [uncultured Roseivirga sp.]|uniref:arsenate reductase (glutaredoxin) n=1 Tax=uncultured Roseivirga sp. TaxID=543088 RepID=UPI000D799915|nr:arsenate reductase (glutaredoxin) [uncultured Roseivirga sp.]PWL29156.1 MAG: arsenate reductase (glutaredoxin) [Roseivirga sp. XM-24bin3]
MLKILHNPRCQKSRQTLQLIEESGEMVTVVEYLKTVPTKDELKGIINMLGIEPLDLVRKGEAVYKEEFKGKDLNNDQWIEAMVQNPKLIERPIVIKGDKAIIGRPPEKVKELLG